ncbi:MAG: TerC/Alx family metal homeostasis membrane protein [Microbacteriaceae bacterium]|nr:TerC/Alx family metal homeostasis membrane protein [Microbacteriaceae bacterium]
MSLTNYQTFELVSMIVLVLIVVADLLLVVARPHIPSNRESSLWVLFYALLASGFGVILWQLFGWQRANEFFAGWLTEYSLSLDNLFVFLILMARFSVPKRLQQEVLMVGIVMALVLRGLFILVGAALVENFSFVFYIFGAFLLYTAWHQAFRTEDEDEESESKLIVWLRKRIQVSEEFDGIKLRTRVNGKKMFTPALVVFIAIAATDVMFAFDSIPAIFGITTDAFIVFTANVFALMGLRQLYFLLGSLVDKLHYLKYGIAFILAFIGVKLVLHAMHENELPFINGGKHIDWAPDITTETSLVVIAGSIILAAIASYVRLSRSKSKKQ